MINITQQVENVENASIAIILNLAPAKWYQLPAMNMIKKQANVSIVFPIFSICKKGNVCSWPMLSKDVDNMRDLIVLDANQTIITLHSTASGRTLIAYSLIKERISALDANKGLSLIIKIVYE